LEDIKPEDLTGDDKRAYEFSQTPDNTAADFIKKVSLALNGICSEDFDDIEISEDVLPEKYQGVL